MKTMNYTEMPKRRWIFILFLLVAGAMWAKAYNMKYPEKVQAKVYSIYSIFK